MIHSYRSLWATTSTIVWLCLVTSIAQAGVVVHSFDDIVHWTGSGANQAALVIDWGDGQDPLVWGYRFDSGHHGDLLREVVQGDGNLFAKMRSFGAFGDFITGLGYDRNQSGNFAISSGTNFGADGYTFSGAGDSATASDPADSYLEAGDVSYWNFWTASGASYPASASWTSSAAGINDTPLANQAWSGFNFVPDFNNPIPPSMPGVAFAAVPEPGAASLLLLSLLTIGMRRHSRRVRCLPASL